MQLRIKINLDSDSMDDDAMGELMRIFTDLPRISNNVMFASDDEQSVYDSYGDPVGTVSLVG